MFGPLGGRFFIEKFALSCRLYIHEADSTEEQWSLYSLPQSNTIQSFTAWLWHFLICCPSTGDQVSLTAVPLRGCLATFHFLGTDRQDSLLIITARCWGNYFSLHRISGMGSPVWDWESSLFKRTSATDVTFPVFNHPSYQSLCGVFFIFLLIGVLFS